MINVLVAKQSNYPVSSPKIKSFLKTFFTDNGIVSDGEVSVALVDKTKMYELGRKFLKDRRLHNVLSFTQEEKPKSFVLPPGQIYLGEIIICYPKAFEEAQLENKRIEEKVLELIEHGANHLLGRHHEL